ncbi:hypothetical protein SLEP1_g31726 [Rubroshorea leprosula]|uniref:TAFII55 protein conserved region domain-containing protein n=1 Tax=Rubroshorea leprosula TaxID=152421 RepID=A0AAV5KB74_9ROSI|nr:hypothetical protein SLEP1_g31726 [Rubroshorea leprosula]
MSISCCLHGSEKQHFFGILLGIQIRIIYWLWNRRIYQLRVSHFAEDGRTGTFVTGSDRFPASLLDLPCVVESFKTYDDSALVKTADIEQMIMVREPGDASPDVEHRHGLNPPMREVIS